MKKRLWLSATIIGVFAIAWIIIEFSYGINKPISEVEEIESIQANDKPVGTQPIPWNLQEIEQILNRKGSVDDNVFKITFPRTDLEVKVGETTIEPSFALTSWLAFKPVENHAMMMGDLVLLDKEVGPVTEILVSNGINVTALHNHLIHESPSVMYLHVSGHGNPTELAKSIKSALSTKTPLSNQKTLVPNKEIDWSGVESILEVKGKSSGNILHLSIPRVETIWEKSMDDEGVTIPPAMGVATAINFQKTDNIVSTTGDFVLLSSEVNPVVQTLTKHGITVTAIHNHMLDESPRLFFLHFWGEDQPEKLAKGLKEALKHTKYKR
jgi:Domain of Unknown Function (DUF1259)